MEIEDSGRLLFTAQGRFKVEHQLKPVTFFGFLDAELFVSGLVVDDLDPGIRQIVHPVYLSFNIRLFVLSVYDSVYSDGRYLLPSSEGSFEPSLQYGSCSYLLHQVPADFHNGFIHAAGTVFFFLSQLEETFPVV